MINGKRLTLSDPNTALIVLVALGIVTRAFNLSQSLFVDEAWVANSVLADSLQRMFHYDWVPAPPPLFLLLVRYTVRIFGSSNVALRLVPSVAAMASIVLLALLARRLLGVTSAVVSVALLVASTAAYRWAILVKQYSSDVFVALLLIWILYHYLDRPTWRRFAIVVAGYGVAILLSYPSVFFIPAGVYVLCAAAWQRRHATPGVYRILAARLALFLIVVAAEWVALFVLLIRPNQSPELMRFWFSDYPGSGVRPAIHYLLLRGPGFATQLLPEDPYFNSRSFVLVALALGVAKSVVSFIRREGDAAHFAVIAGSVFIGVFAAAALKQYPLAEERTSLFALPLLILWGVIGLRAMVDGVIGRWSSERWRDWMAIGLRWSSVAAGLVFFVVAVLKYPGPTEDGEAAVRYLKGRARAGDALYVHASMFEQFKFYDARQVPHDPFAVYYGDTGWRCCTRNNETFLKTMDQDYLRKDLLSFLGAAPAGTKWFLFIDRPGDWGGRDDPRLFRELLESRQCRQETEQKFRGVLVWSYRCAT